MSEVLNRYRDFFGLFGDFRGYVDHFLLQDLVTPDCGAVHLFHPNENFTTPAVPETRDAYLEYKNRSIDFIQARNARIRNESLERTTIGD